MLSTEDKRWLTDVLDARFEEQDKRIDSLRKEMYELAAETRNEMDRQISGVRNDFGNQVSDLRNDFGNQISNLREDLGNQISDLREEMHTFAANINRQLDHLMEYVPGAGHTYKDHEERITVLENNDRDKTHLLTNLYKQINAAK